MKNSHKRRKRKGKVIWGFIGVLVLTAAIVFGLFRVNEILSLIPRFFYN